MGGGILILVIMLIIWAVTSIKDNIKAAQYKEDTKGMSYEEIRHYNYRKAWAEKGYDAPTLEEFKKIQEDYNEKRTREIHEEVEREFEERKRIAREIINR